MVETNVDGESNLVVVAEKDNTEWQTFLSSEVQSGATVTPHEFGDNGGSESIC